MSEDFIAKLPAHAASLSLTHNECHNYYQTVAQMIAESDNYPGDCWISEAEKAKAVVENDYWCLHWYPSTPVGFIVLCAHDLDALLAVARSAK